MAIRTLSLTLLLLITNALQPAALQAAEASETDEATGLRIDEGWALVKEKCTRCHSPLLITQNSGSEPVWLSRIRWMQETQGLEDLAAVDEAAILAYLARNYGPKAASRRSALAPALLPRNPYALTSD